MSVVTGMVMVATLAASPVASAAVDMFMKIDQIPGESRDSVHKNEIDVLAWSWGAAKPPSKSCVSVQDISFTKYVDAASPKLIAAVGTGQPIPTAKLIVRKAGDIPFEYHSDRTEQRARLVAIDGWLRRGGQAHRECNAEFCHDEVHLRAANGKGNGRYTWSGQHCKYLPQVAKHRHHYLSDVPRRDVDYRLHQRDKSRTDVYGLHWLRRVIL